MSIAALALLTACSNAPSTQGVQESFVTHIYPNDSKTFRYNFSRGDKTRPLIPYDQTGGFTDGRNVYTAAELRNKNERYLKGGIERTLAETNYCREGYFILDSLISYSGGSLRGECKEAASEADKAAFPNRKAGTL